MFYVKGYDGKRVTPYDEKFIADRSGMRLGPPRMRQVRVIKGECIMNLYILLIAYYPSRL